MSATVSQHTLSFLMSRFIPCSASGWRACHGRASRLGGPTIYIPCHAVTFHKSSPLQPDALKSELAVASSVLGAP
eukprot:8570392-Pyramimonas_sp.AAC.1